MKYVNIQLSVFVAVLLIFQTVCDIPVHCVKSQIEGQWLIHATKAKIRNDLYKFTCGHKLPSKESHAFTVKPNKSFKLRYKITLKSNDVSELYNKRAVKVKYISLNRKGNGQWYITKDLIF